MLSFDQFYILNRCRMTTGLTQRELAEGAPFSLGSTNRALRELFEMELVDENNAVTTRGMKALLPYKVDNAVIMAAGLSSRFAPISYEKPKGILNVRGEVLIERQIRQLKEAGITSIAVVVGYKKEQFFYLEDKFGVDIVVNPDYLTRNNNSSIRRVQHLLGNTYICSSDNYFTENPFEEYVYSSYYSTEYAEGETAEWCLETSGKRNLISKVTIGGTNSWIMLGHAYWDRSFSATFSRILDDEYEKPETAEKLWEAIYSEHIDELPMIARKYPSGVIFEFDSLDDLRAFDPSFIKNVNSNIFANISDVLKCDIDKIHNIIPIKQGLTNLSFRFTVDDAEFVYRNPGPGSNQITNRRAETIAEQIAAREGIDETFIYEDPEIGWKICHYLANRRALDYHNWDDVAAAMTLCRRLHALDVDCGYNFDIHDDTLHTLEMLDAKHKAEFTDFNELFAMAERFNNLAKRIGAHTVLSHNDFYPPNFLVARDGDIQLIDWEYAGMSDHASDPAVFICCCSDYSYEDAVRVFELYYGRKMHDHELFHCVAYSCVVAFHWLVWALYQDAYSEPVGELLYYYYRYTKIFGKEADRLAEKLGL